MGWQETVKVKRVTIVTIVSIGPKELSRTPVLKRMKWETCLQTKDRRLILNICGIIEVYLRRKYSKCVSTVRKIMKQLMMSRVCSNAGYAVWDATDVGATIKHEKWNCIRYQRDIYGCAMSARKRL